MSDYIERMKDEYKELDERVTKLEVFTETSTFDSLSKTNRHMMLQQLAYMKGYREILDGRLWLAHGNK